MIEAAEFETAIVGRPVFRLTPSDDAGAVAASVRSCRDHVIGKVAGHRYEILNVLLDEGFRISCASVHLRCVQLPTAAGPNAEVRPLTKDDLAAAEEIVASAFAEGNRFANDPLIGAHARELHRTWMRNSFNGYADACIGVHIGGGLTGVATLHLDGKKSSLGLIAVDPGTRRSGVGSALLHAASQIADGDGAETLDVITESHNAPAVNFYMRSGFVVQGSEFSVYRMAA